MPWVHNWVHNFMEGGAPDSFEDITGTVSLRDLTIALQAVLKREFKPALKTGDKLTISATVTGANKGTVNVVFDDVPSDCNRSWTFPSNILALASKKS